MEGGTDSKLHDLPYLQTSVQYRKLLSWKHLAAHHRDTPQAARQQHSLQECMVLQKKYRVETKGLPPKAGLYEARVASLQRHQIADGARCR
jgi:hypothetical protein